MAKSTTTPANPEQLEMDQLAEIESDRLRKQVSGKMEEKMKNIKHSPQLCEHRLMAVVFAASQNGKRSHSIFGWEEECDGEA